MIRRPIQLLIGVLVVASLALARVNSVPAFLAVAGFLAVTGLIFSIPWLWLGRGWDPRLRDRRRVAATKSVAGELGLEFSPRDPAKLARAVPLATFGNGPQPGCRNFMWGTWRHRRVIGFEFWSNDLRMPDHRPLRDPRTGLRRASGTSTAALHSFVAARIDADCPAMVIERRGLRTAAQPSLALQEVHLESERFDRALRVIAKDQRAATVVLDPRMMELLAKLAPTSRVTIEGGWVALLSPLEAPEDLRSTFDAVVTIANHVPRVVASLYPRRDASAGPSPAGEVSTGTEGRT